MLHEHAATLSTAVIGNRSRRMTNARKILDSTVVFHLLKGPEAEDHTLYASHTVWESRAVFEAWTKS